MEIIKRLKAISDETRLRILYLLLDYELNVNEIVSVIGMIQSGVSRHLRILTESGLLVPRKEGSYIYYSAVINSSNSKIVDMVRHGLSNEDQGKRDIASAEKVIRDRRRKNQHFFQHVAEEWDVLKRKVIGGLDINRLIVGKVNGCGSIADLGCGTGELLGQLVSMPQIRLIGVDSSVEMLNQARGRLESVKRVDLRLGELEHLPMRDEETGCVVMNMVLHHIAMPREVILEASRVLTGKGRFIISEFEKHDNENVRRIIGGAWLGLDSVNIGSWLTEAGFDLLSKETYPVNYGLSVNLFCSQKKMTERL